MSEPLHWSPRWPPLAAEYVVARGAAARALAAVLLAAPERLARLRGVVAGDVLALTGEDLPWVDGAEYFGRDGAAAWLLMPTQWATSVPTSWLERRYRAVRVDWPCLLLRDGATQLLLPVGLAAAIDARRLADWMTDV